MKKFPVLIFALLLTLRINAQITIASADLTHANDTFRVSSGQAFTGMDPTLSGPNYNWDYTQLAAVSQTVDTFISVNSTNPLFSIIFIDNALNSNRANQATNGTSFSLGTVSISDVFNFFYNGSSVFKQVGFGATINGIPLPIVYSPHDRIYTLPLHYADADSSDSGYEVDLTSTLGILYSVKRNRSNVVDGWGSLSTPYGTFDVLRVHSTVTERDSVYIDSLGFGFNTPPIVSHEYKWLGAGQGIPLLQINTGTGGVVSQITYKDSLRGTVGISTPALLQGELLISPNPAVDRAEVNFELNQPATVSFELYSSRGQMVYQGKPVQFSSGRQSTELPLKSLNLSAGNYLLKCKMGDAVYLKTLLISR